MLSQEQTNTPIKRKGSTFVSVYLVLREEDRVCLLLRKNTGYMDGFYGLIAGHVEEGESATAGMIREAYEEAGLILSPSNLRVAHIMHRKSSETRLGIDLFFECNSWEGKLENREPDKCGDLSFFPLDALPLNTAPYIAYAIKAVRMGQFYSEDGWSTN